MFRWLKAKFDTARAYVRKKLSEALALFEDLADDFEAYGNDFLALVSTVGPAIEAKIIQVQTAFPDLAGDLKLGKVVDWVREHHAEFVPYVKQLRTWISAVVALRKAAGLFR